MTDETNKTGQNDNTPPGAGSPAGSQDKRQEQGRAPGAAAQTASEVGGPHSSDPVSAPDLSSAAESAPFDVTAMLRAQVEELEKQQVDLTDRLAKAQEDIHRYQAEIQNLHRRREKEAEEAGKYAITKFARDTVAVADNFERAITSVPAEATHDNPVLKSLLDGVTMTEREFLNVLERHGVKRVSPKDELFDPHKHQAVMEQENPAVPAGTVLQVYQPGYIISDRILRPAMVVVARGGPKPEKASFEQTTDEAASDKAATEPDTDAQSQQPEAAAKSTQGPDAGQPPDEATLKNGTNNN